MDIVVTVPKTEIETFEKEVVEMKEQNLKKRFRFSPPSMLEIGNKVFFVLDGQIRFEGVCTGLDQSEFECQITGRRWKCQFLEVKDIKAAEAGNRIKMKGFQGFRYRTWGELQE